MGMLDHLDKTFLIGQVYENGIFTFLHLGICETSTGQLCHKLLNQALDMKLK